MFSVKSFVDRYFGTTPKSPYTDKDEEFRTLFTQKATPTHIQGVMTRLEKRYNLRANSIGHMVLFVTVILAGTFVYFDTVADTITSVDEWARPMFVPSLWVTIYAIWRLALAVKADDGEINPNPMYSGDEIKQALETTYGETALDETQPDTADIEIAKGQLNEVAGRTSHDRKTLQRRRYFKNQALKGFMLALVLFGVALTAYAFAGWFI